MQRRKGKIYAFECRVPKNSKRDKKAFLSYHCKEIEGNNRLGKGYVKAVYCHPAYSAFMEGTSCEMPGWMKHKLESRLLGEISVTSDMQMIPPLWQKVKN